MVKLDAELKDLKLVAGVRSTLPLVVAGGAGNPLAKTALVRKQLGESWEDAASRESLIRQWSDAENQRLRKILRMHVQHARKLQFMLTQRLTTANIESALGFRHVMALEELVGRPRDNEIIFQRLLTELGQLQHDVVIARSKVEPHVWIKSGYGLYLQFMDQYMVPFSVDATERAIQRMLTAPKDDNVIYDELHEVDSFTNLQSVRACMSSGNL